MSTSLLYHGFGIRGYYHDSTKFESGTIVFNIKHDELKLRCPDCKSREFKKRGTKNRTFKAQPVGKREVFINLPIQRIECLCCQKIHQVKLDFADTMRTFTNGFERYALDLCRLMPISDVADLLNVSWGTIKDIDKRYLKKKYDKPKLKALKRMAIDEIYLGRKMKYITLVMDLETGAVVYVGEGKGSQSLSEFWKKIRRAKANIEAVATDMVPAYIKAVYDNLPGVPIVLDHFHVIKLYNEKLSDLRRDLQRDAEAEQKNVLKGTRWLLLKSSKNLDSDGDEGEKLRKALELNEPLAMAYYLKDDLGQVWKQDDKQEADFLLLKWIQKAASSGVTMLKKFAKLLSKYTNEILAYYDFNKMSSGLRIPSLYNT